MNYTSRKHDIVFYLQNGGTFKMHTSIPSIGRSAAGVFSVMNVSVQSWIRPIKRIIGGWWKMIVLVLSERWVVWKLLEAMSLGSEVLTGSFYHSFSISLSLSLSLSLSTPLSLYHYLFMCLSHFFLLISLCFFVYLCFGFRIPLFLLPCWHSLLFFLSVVSLSLWFFLSFSHSLSFSIFMNLSLNPLLRQYQTPTATTNKTLIIQFPHPLIIHNTHPSCNLGTMGREEWGP